MTTRPQPARLRRDLGLRNVAKATRWAAAASLGLVAVFATLAAESLPGHRAAPAAPAPASTPSQPASSQSSGGQSAGSQSAGSQSSGGQSSGGQGAALAPATQAPTTTIAAPVVVSGGS